MAPSTLAPPAPRCARSARRTRRLSWGLLLWYVLVALGAWELGLRLSHLKQRALAAGLEHPHFHHRLRPDADYRFTTDEFDVTIHTNRFGLRGPTPVVPKPPGVIRIMMMGDSYIFGFPVKDDETASVLVERALRAKGYPVEVVNVGVSGYSPTLQYVSLRDQFLDFQPDLVVLWYDLGDLTEDYTFQKNILRDAQGGIARIDPRYINGRYDWWEAAQRHSALAKYLNNRLVRTWSKIRTLGLGGYLGVILRGERAKVAIARLKLEQGASDLPAYDKFVLVRPKATREQLEPLWQLSQRYLDMIRALLDERHIPLVMGIYPYGMLVGPGEWGDGRVYWGFAKGQVYSADTYVSLLRDYTSSRDVPFVNALDRFRRAVGPQPLFYNWDGHFTPAGQRVLAEALTQDVGFLAVLDRLVAARARARRR